TAELFRQDLPQFLLCHVSHLPQPAARPWVAAAALRSLPYDTVARGGSSRGSVGKTHRNLRFNLVQFPHRAAQPPLQRPFCPAGRVTFSGPPAGSGCRSRRPPPCSPPS